ncbi:uncharacterized protein LOC130622758 isoform X2 [Hydractinia symbiolongicarpus]|uniref:uncharacterized protein LOC130622758 isoform X2 n=1 Tax=Hydractinia symbiolongicarpus TaxID=13093 RepID=UPI0025503EBE|nr:uncharacterized protein LOC130622758 isoform X2 [Hydractinia symbiolongicarpus]XP_057294239.1 uncharacterized protein LOC130622758 isoform X2 [Hydractinia symbiolongicarpus]
MENSGQKRDADITAEVKPTNIKYAKRLKECQVCGLQNAAAKKLLGLHEKEGHHAIVLYIKKGESNITMDQYATPGFATQYLEGTASDSLGSLLKQSFRNNFEAYLSTTLKTAVQEPCRIPSAAERINNVSTDNPTMQHTGKSMQESKLFMLISFRSELCHSSF